MILEIVEMPEKVLSDGHICKFPSAFNPAKVVIQRKDYDILSAEDYEGFVKINLDPKAGITPSGMSAYIYAADSADPILANVLLDGVFNVFYEEDVDGKVETIILPEEVWDAKYLDISVGYIVVSTTDKQDLLISGSVSSEALPPRRVSFSVGGLAYIYINSIVKDYFSKRLETDDYFCIGQALAIALKMSVDIATPDYPEGVEVEIEQDYGLTPVKSVRQLGSNIILSDYAVYLRMAVSFIVTDEDTSLAIEGALVSIAGQSGLTDASGTIRFTEIDPGSYTYVVSKTGYDTKSQAVTISKSVTYNVELTPETVGTTYPRTYDGTNLRKHTDNDDDVRIYRE